MQDEESHCACPPAPSCAYTGSVVYGIVLPLGDSHQFHQQKASCRPQDSAVPVPVSVQCKQRFSNLHSFVVPI